MGGEENGEQTLSSVITPTILGQALAADSDLAFKRWKTSLSVSLNWANSDHVKDSDFLKQNEKKKRYEKGNSIQKKKKRGALTGSQATLGKPVPNPEPVLSAAK